MKCENCGGPNERGYTHCSWCRAVSDVAVVGGNRVTASGTYEQKMRQLRAMLDTMLASDPVTVSSHDLAPSPIRLYRA